MHFFIRFGKNKNLGQTSSPPSAAKIHIFVMPFKQMCCYCKAKLNGFTFSFGIFA